MRSDFRYISNDLEIIYNECDNCYIDQLISYFYSEKIKVFDFFNIKKLSKKLVIVIYDNIDKYANYRNNHINDTSIGNIDFDDNNYYLNILSYKEIIKRKGHEKNNLEYMYKTVIHEFTHICHEEIGTYKDSLIWVKEGIAIVLSNQYNGIKYKLNNCSVEDLISDRRTWYINYYSLMDYALNKYGLKYIRNLVFDTDFAKKETKNIYTKLVEYISNK